MLELGCQRWTATAGAAFVALDNAQIAIARFILLDTPLIFFCFLAVFCALRLANTRYVSVCVCVNACESELDAGCMHQ